jgi:hypothetical protein
MVIKPKTRIDKIRTWPLMYTEYALFAFLALIGIHLLVFGSMIMPLLVLLCGMFIVVFFFVALNRYSERWCKLPMDRFYRRLFGHALVYRLIFVVVMLMLTNWLDPDSYPFEIRAADSWVYHDVGIKVAEGIRNGNMFDVLNEIWRSFNDWGHSIYLGFLYYVFGPHFIVVRIFNALFGALTTVYVGKIAEYVFGRSAGRMAGILAMLMPAFWWYGGMHLKETMMIFLIIVPCYHAVKLVYIGKLKPLGITVITGSIFLLFYYRSFLAPLITLCIGGYILLNAFKKKRNQGVIIVSAVAFLLAMGLIISRFEFQGHIAETVEQSQGLFDYHLTNIAKEVEEISFEKGVVAPFMLAGAVVTPFPTFLDIGERQLSIYVRFQNDVVRNFLYFFAFLGVWYGVKLKLNESALVILFPLGYILILAVSGVSFQARYQVPALPFMIILMAGGFHLAKPKILNRWPMYLTIIMAAILAWNYFKVSIRGLM